jgi:type I restriction enzyme S subunit
LWHWLAATAPTLNAKAKGATFKQVNREDIGSLPISPPDLSVQRRIATILDQADVLRSKRRAALAQLDAFAESIFIDMFGDPATNPKGWPVRTVGEVADVQGGLQVTSARNHRPREVLYLRVANVYRGRLDLREIKTLRATESEIERTALRAGDFLIVEGHGNPSEIGRGAIWTGAIPLCVHQNHLIRLRFDTEHVLPAYAAEFLNSSGGRRYLIRAGNTTSGLNTISVSDVRMTPIAIPPMTVQSQFVTRISRVAGLRGLHRASLSALDAFFASLQYRAFAGTP